MSKKSSLLAVERVLIVLLHVEKHSKRQIAKRLQCCKSLVHRAIEKFKNHEIYDNMKKLVETVKRHEEMIMPSDKLSCNLPLVLIVKYLPIY